MEIQIKGTIIPNEDKNLYEYYGYENTCPKDVSTAFEKVGDDENVDIYINSGGGDIFSATEIYSVIQKYKNKAKIHVVGLAASAASVIMCAAENDISATSMVMIHNVSSIAQGNFKDFKHESDFLPLMDKETWFTAQEAVDIGLCDKVVGKDVLVGGYCSFVTDEQRNQYENTKAKAQLQIRLEKLKGDVKS